jgi:hypothetical protein
MRSAISKLGFANDDQMLFLQCIAFLVRAAKKLRRESYSFKFGRMPRRRFVARVTC